MRSLANKRSTTDAFGWSNDLLFPDHDLTKPKRKSLTHNIARLQSLFLQGKLSVLMIHILSSSSLTVLNKVSELEQQQRAARLLPPSLRYISSPAGLLKPAGLKPCLLILA